METDVPFSIGGWLPDQETIGEWLTGVLTEMEQETEGWRRPKPLHPVIRELKQFIDTTPEVYMLFRAMLWQNRETKTPTKYPQVKDVDVLLQLFNRFMTRAPQWNDSGVVGFPFNAALNWPMGTHAGLSVFLNRQVNAHFKKMLNTWSTFLRSPDSRDVLTADRGTGWFSERALAEMKKRNGADFEDLFDCDPSKPYWGFASWDDFFTRPFRAGKRPPAEGADVIVNACESTPFRLSTNVEREALFWLKGQPYSVAHMLDHHPLAEEFVGGTIYQAFLDAYAYHRWHSPVDGTIVGTRVVDGTYFSTSHLAGKDAAAPDKSQPYLTQVATRAMIFIEADNPAIGTMCALPVGMADVSSCDVTVYEGQRVAKGDQLGMFHHGGSTHCLMFRKGVDLTFEPQKFPGEKNVLLNAKLATVRK
ncbi:phosphatidylserine decarboxylase family protein [Streptomyces specialis]|uniref:phosphatidylserine decarboxylase family protein n=1 Tax=Streptomyces specialis TaxID=498367 RepID=UPI00073EC473|nr:phosphatidylserine decarboxylase family protein [Streptomyces specialis]